MRIKLASISIPTIWGVWFLAILLLLVFGVVSNKSASASDNRVVTISVDGQEQTISTSVETVNEVLDRAGVEVSKHDLVEPAQDTKILTGVFSINVYRARPVTVVDGNVEKTVMSPYDSPRLIAQSAGIKVFNEDRYILERVNDIVTSGAIGERLTVDRATLVTINYYGNLIKHRTHKEKVKAVLEEKNIKYKANDTIRPSLHTEIRSGSTISIVQNGTRIITKTEVIPASVETIRDNNMKLGEQKVKQEGSDGSKIVTYKQKLENGRVISKQVVEEVIKKQPVKRIVIVGTLSTYSGGPLSEEQINFLGNCESGMTANRNSGNGYYGAFQFSESTWNSQGTGYARADLAPLEVQKQAVQRLLSGSSIHGQFPGCAAQMSAQGLL